MKEQDKFTGHFRNVSVRFSRLYTRILTRADLTFPQYALLNYLSIAGIVPMTQVSKELHISKPAVTNLVDRLENNKYLKRLPHPKDRRIYLLHIQPKGEQIVRKTQSQVLRILLQTLNQFNAHERRVINQFYSLLATTIGNALKVTRK